MTGSTGRPQSSAISRRRLCLHADDPTRAAHWLAPGELCEADIVSAASRLTHEATDRADHDDATLDTPPPTTKD